MMDVVIFGGLVRTVQALIAAAPTVLTGLSVAAVFRYYLKGDGIRRLFGSSTWRSIPQSWAIGMLLPVCSIGVIPILREMRRARVPVGSLTAFALSAPLFNPLSLLYGLTLSRPTVIVGFAFASLFVVTILGILWDRLEKGHVRHEEYPESAAIGLTRLWMCCTYVARELAGAGGLWMLLGVSGVWVLATILPHGALQTSVEQLDPKAPVIMTLVAIPVYATPMLAMSQLGMMFAHGNSPGAAFCLLLFGTGINLATLVWIYKNYGVRSSSIWLIALVGIVLGLAYGLERPLLPPGIEPAGHTHAFDIYTNPFSGVVSYPQFLDILKKSLGIGELVGVVMLGVTLLCGLLARWLGLGKESVMHGSAGAGGEVGKFDRVVSPSWVAAVSMAGLVAFSIVGCYAFYPPPEECLEEMRIARGETLSAARSGDSKHALVFLEVWDEWSRRLEVGTVIRRFSLRPYQHQQAELLRKKLELLEHELEHDPYEQEEVNKVADSLSLTSARLRRAFATP